MIRLLQFLILGHIHKWNTIREGYLYKTGALRGEALPIGTVYYQQCEHCGKVIRRTLTK